MLHNTPVKSMGCTLVHFLNYRKLFEWEVCPGNETCTVPLCNFFMPDPLQLPKASE